MATFTITTKASPVPTALPSILRHNVDDCDTLVTLVVPVPAGESRRVVITNSYDPGENVDADVTTLTTYDLHMNGNTYDLPLIETDTITINISLAPGSPVFFSKTYTRTHTGSTC